MSYVQEASLNSRKIFLGMLLACVYCWLTIATTDEARLLTNSASSPLPIVQTEIPIAWFYWVAFLIIVGVYFYFHIYLYKVWDGLIRLSARFPDGRSLAAKIYPWLVSGLARSHIRQAKVEARREFPGPRRTGMPFLENAISILLAWWLAPLTLLLFWIRYLPRHDWIATTVQVVGWIVATLAGFAFYILMVRTLQRMEIPFSEAVRTLGRRTVFVLIALVATSMIGLSCAALSGARIEIAGLRTFADLEEREVSTRPENWDPEQLRLVKGAQLRSMDLRNARASGAFLVNADLRDADLEDAVLSNADLRGADFEGAVLAGADLRGADLREARNLIQAQLDRACGDGNTKLPPRLSIRPCPTGG